jgi:hypothetical protein
MAGSAQAQTPGSCAAPPQYDSVICAQVQNAVGGADLTVNADNTVCTPVGAGACTFATPAFVPVAAPVLTLEDGTTVTSLPFGGTGLLSVLADGSQGVATTLFLSDPTGDLVVLDANTVFQKAWCQSLSDLQCQAAYQVTGFNGASAAYAVYCCTQTQLSVPGSIDSDQLVSGGLPVDLKTSDGTVDATLRPLGAGPGAGAARVRHLRAQDAVVVARRPHHRWRVRLSAADRRDLRRRGHGRYRLRVVHVDHGGRRHVFTRAVRAR